MNRTELRFYLRAIGVSAIAGLRSMTAPALLSYAASHRGSANLEGTPFGGLGSEKVSATLCALAVGEMVVDKLPVAPDRTIPPSVIFRALSGALVGSALFAAEDRDTRAGALLGAAAAVAATYAAFHIRKAATQRGGLPDTLVALAEDALAVGSGLGALRA